ncbi:hypothetical protein UFOVP649_5 [uncultured Caudovirales phage]|uniref:Uncharacterized protein n=1 Tax=uncultured Caudovirales phage TaxID=2100421 RepID=A0A6J5N6C1_9CAUD|nr:hypothetical protein UFOVP649_5 [uncultured Caudovirales phage]
MAIIGAKLINAENIENALIQAFNIWVEEDINKKHWDEQFKNMSKWDYDLGDKPTVRKNGQTVDSPRDIYDLGDLYESGLKTVLENTGAMVTANWHWDAKNTSGKEYAIYVHEGLGSNTTARPFTDDISVASSFFLKAPGINFKLRVRKAMAAL